MADYDWLIVGGGPHGRFIAASLAAAVPGIRVAVIDPAAPLAAWRSRANACGMTWLRSSGAHHLGLRADSLRHFARAHGYDEHHTLGRYRRPSLALFNHHAATVLGHPEQLQCAARSLVRTVGGWRVHLDDGRSPTTGRVVLATGPGVPYRPTGLADSEHVFDSSFSLGGPQGKTVVNGGGISGAQLALRAHDAGHRVCWLTRHPPQGENFDADPCYAGPRCMIPFLAGSFAVRSWLLASARQPGTMPPDIYRAITARLATGALNRHCGIPKQLIDAGVILEDRRIIRADRVILATGFSRQFTPDSLLGRICSDFALTGDGQGHLHLDETLAVRPGLHVTGRPASLQLGPMAGNIKGARMAGRILAAVACREHGPAVEIAS